MKVDDNTSGTRSFVPQGAFFHVWINAVYLVVLAITKFSWHYRMINSDSGINEPYSLTSRLQNIP